MATPCTTSSQRILLLKILRVSRRFLSVFWKKDFQQWLGTEVASWQPNTSDLKNKTSCFIFFLAKKVIWNKLFDVKNDNNWNSMKNILTQTRNTSRPKWSNIGRLFKVKVKRWHDRVVSCYHTVITGKHVVQILLWTNLHTNDVRENSIDLKFGFEWWIFTLLTLKVNNKMFYCWYLSYIHLKEWGI